MIQSKTTDKNKYEFVNIKQLDNTFVDKEVWIRGRIHTSRGKGEYQLSNNLFPLYVFDNFFFQR